MLSFALKFLATVIIVALGTLNGVSAIERYGEWKRSHDKSDLYIAVWMAVWFVLITLSAAKVYLPSFS